MKHVLRSILFIIIFVALLYAAYVAVSDAPLKDYVRSANPFYIVLLLSVVFAATCFVVGATTGDYSWVDRSWSIAPIIYGWLYAWRSGYAAWSVIGAVLVALWGARLTFNFTRKGGFSGLEDYRWPILREKISNRFLWQVFNLLFICGFQVALFAFFTSPLYLLISSAQHAGSVGPLVVTVLAFGALVWETIADEQQWKFHRLKANRDTESRWSEDVTKGFLSSGLFGLCRHPAYFGELAFWWLIYLLLVTVSGTLLQWVIVGPAVLTALFVGSTLFTESITSSKYSDYVDYKKRTSAIIPWPSKKGK